MEIALWIAVFILLISNIGLTIKVRRLERKMKVEMPVQDSSGEAIFHTIIKEFSKGMEKIIDLKKLRQSAPEA